MLRRSNLEQLHVPSSQTSTIFRVLLDVPPHAPFPHSSEPPVDPPELSLVTRPSLPRDVSVNSG